jgi:hypothetical protein
MKGEKRRKEKKIKRQKRRQPDHEMGMLIDGFEKKAHSAAKGTGWPPNNLRLLLQLPHPICLPSD